MAPFAKEFFAAVKAIPKDFTVNDVVDQVKQEVSSDARNALEEFAAQGRDAARAAAKALEGIATPQGKGFYKGLGPQRRGASGRW
ncbi:hypothetical protein CCP3SC15_2050001 [Gammaproteobacteria bacterium]